MTIQLERLLQSLEATGKAIPHLTAAVSIEDARWKPQDGAWSVLEIVTHLADEEVDDFRARIRTTLDDPESEWAPIDPEGWARERNYNEGDLKENVERFVCERAASLAWLRGLSNPDWSLAYNHPKFGPIAAGELMGSWVAHDCLHVRQLAKRLHQLADRNSGEFGLAYAGDW